MTEELYELHLNAARKAGKDASCGKKQWYVNYELGWKAAARLNESPNSRHKVEPYPCPFCDRWHIGRVMSVEELKSKIYE